MIRILYILIVIGCLFPPISACWDEYVLPKWYVCGIMSCIIFFCYALKRSSDNKHLTLTVMKKDISVAALSGIIFESVWIIGQILHSGTGILNNAIRGTFDNPCGLSTTLCILLPFTFLQIESNHHRENIKRNIHDKCVLWCFALVAFLTVFFVLLSKSRTGMMSLAAMAVIVIFRHAHTRKLYRWLSVLLIVTATSLMAISQKVDSTNGRLFILKQTWTLIERHPVIGYGFNGFRKEYMRQQGTFLAQHPMAAEAKLVDEVKHPLNEFVLLWLEHGVIGPLLLFFLLFVPAYAFRQSLPILAAQSSIFISCLFSYPFNEPLPCMVVLAVSIASLLRCSSLTRAMTAKIKVRTFCLTSCFLLFSVLFVFFRVDSVMSSANFYTLHHKHHHALNRYEQLDSMFCHPPYLWIAPYCRSFFLYKYSYELFATAQFDKAYQKACDCADEMSGYDLELLTGDICSHRNDYTNAVQHYRVAYNMCPVRFAPLNGMLRLYQMKHEHALADSIALVIMNKPVKIQSPEVYSIKVNAKDLLKAK